jgi:transposase
MAMTQAHWNLAAKEHVVRQKAGGDSGLEALRVLKRRLSDVHRAMHVDLAVKRQPAFPANESAAAAACQRS